MKHDARERFIITARLLLELLLAVVFVVAFDCSHLRMVDRALRRLLELFFDIISSAFAAADGEYERLSQSLQLKLAPLPSLSWMPSESVLFVVAFFRLRSDRLREDDVRRCTHDAAAVADKISRGAIFSEILL